MNEKTIKLLDEAVTQIRIEVMKGATKEALDQLLYELQITIFKQVDE